MNKVKGIALAAGIGVAAAAVAVGAFLMDSGSESYRSIQVQQVEGTANVERASVGTIDAYDNMMLQSEDTIYVSEDSYVQLKMDDDKYILLEPKTKIYLEAEGDSVDSRTVIHLEQGAIVNRLDNELSENSVYEINTPNSTMAVRGTTFRVEVTYDEKGVSYAMLLTYEGEVECCLIYPDGTKDTQLVSVAAGTQVSTWGDDRDSDYVTSVEEAEYEKLRQRVLEFLEIAIQEGKQLSISEEELNHLMEILEAEEDGSLQDVDEGDDEKPADDAAESENLEQETLENEDENNDENDEENNKTSEESDQDLTEEESSSQDIPEDEDAVSGGGDSGSGGSGTDSGSSGSGSGDSGTDSGGSGSDSGDSGTDSGDSGSDSGDSGTDSGDSGQGGTEDEATEYTVTFTYNGSTFATQTVTAGGTATEPVFLPTASGSWNHTFSDAINADTTIEWSSN